MRVVQVNPGEPWTASSRSQNPFRGGLDHAVRPAFGNPKIGAVSTVAVSIVMSRTLLPAADPGEIGVGCRTTRRNHAPIVAAARTAPMSTTLGRRPASCDFVALRGGRLARELVRLSALISDVC